MKGLKISYFGFSAIFGVCITPSESAGSEHSTRRAAVELALNKIISESDMGQESCLGWLRGGAEPWSSICVSHIQLLGRASDPRCDPAQCLGRAGILTEALGGNLILQHSQRAGLFYTKYLHFLWLLRAGYSFGLFWPGQVWAFLQRFLVQLFISTRSLKNIACPQCHARLKHQQAVSLSFAHPLCVVLW